MSDDLTERLRDLAGGPLDHRPADTLVSVPKRRLMQAADLIDAQARRIEQLETEGASLSTQIDRVYGIYHELHDERAEAHAERDAALATIERLREALRSIYALDGAFLDVDDIAEAAIDKAYAALADTEETTDG